MASPYALRLGDDDALNRWGGAEHPTDPPNTFVADLQASLSKLGFGLVRAVPGKAGDRRGYFGYWTAFAVREFQIYAKAPWAARDASETGDPLSYQIVKKIKKDQDSELYPPDKPISGVVNADTARLILLWYTNKWRCPLIICGFSKPPPIKDGHFSDPGAAKALLVVRNAWSRFDHVAGAKYYYCVDYSGSIPDKDGNLPDMSSGKPLVDGAGRANATGKWGSKGYGGPTLDQALLSDPDAAITPETLIGKPRNALTDPEKATYRVVHAIANREAAGRFDAVNGWDTQVLSFGPYQFALTAADTAIDPNDPKKRKRLNRPQDGELPAFLAMLSAGSADQKASYERRFGSYGMGSNQNWSAIKPNPGLRAYFARLTFTGPMSRPPDDIPETSKCIWPEIAEAKEPVRSWHMFYRLLVTGRRERFIRTALWRYCRLRIKNVLSTPWGAMPKGYEDWSIAPTSIGSVFRSERSVGMLLRVHVKLPSSLAWVDTNNKVAVRDVLRSAISKFEYEDKYKHPDRWSLKSEEALVKALLTALKDAKKPGKGKKRDPLLTSDLVNDCTSFAAGGKATPLGSLSIARNFKLDDSGL